MGLRIGTNVAALVVQRHMRVAQDNVDHALKSLASGQRIVQAGDDAAGFAIGESLRGQINGLRQAKSNTENATSFIQVAEGGLNEQNNILIRLRELAVQSASDTVSEKERGFLNEEFEQLVSEFDRIALTTTFGSKQLLAGKSKDYEFQIGPNPSPENIVKYTLDVNTTTQAMGLAGMNVLEQDTARETLTSLDEALYSIAGARSNFGAIQSRMMAARDNIDVQVENIEAAHSVIMDADIAAETSKLAQNQIRQSIGVAVLAQANQTTRDALRLIG